MHLFFTADNSARNNKNLNTASVNTNRDSGSSHTIVALLMVKFVALGYIHSTTVINIIQPIYWQGIYHYYFFLLFYRTWGRPSIELYRKNKKKWQIFGRNMGTDLWGSIPLTRYISHFMSLLWQLHHRSLYDSITTICSERCKTAK